MRIIVSVQSKRGSSRGLVHYLSHSKIDTSKELLGGRQLFNDYSEAIDVKKANIFLKTGTSSKRPSNEELHHIVISLKPEDYEKLGADEKERLGSLKEITRYAMKRFEESIGAQALTWAGSIHRNTKNPHVHIALQKQFFDREFEKRDLAKIPRECLPHYERTGIEKIFSSGVLISAASEKLDEIVIEKSKTMEARLHAAEEQTHSKKETEAEQNIGKENGSKLVSKESISDLINIHERDVLARSLIAKYFLDESEKKLESIAKNGHKRRFLIFDTVTNQKRRMSLVDFERRADDAAASELRRLKISDGSGVAELKKHFLDAEFNQNAVGIKRIRTILFKTASREERIRQQREEEYKLIGSEEQKIRSAFRRENRMLPTPSLTKDELDMLQDAGVANSDVRSVNYLERVRSELVGAGKILPRNQEDIQRLKASRMLADLKCRLKDQDLRAFAEKRHSLDIVVGPERWSLAKLDRIAENSLKTSTLSDRISSIFLNKAAGETEDTRLPYTEIKRTIIERLENEKERLVSELKQAKTTAKILENLYSNDPDHEKYNIAAKFNAEQLAETEAIAFRLKLPEVYRQNWVEQKAFIMSGAAEAKASNKESISGLRISKSSESAEQSVVAGRAIAREIVCEMELMKTTEVFRKFKKNSRLHKFELADDKNGGSKFVSLAEVEIRQRGSIFDQALDYLLENRERRQTRHLLQTLIKEKEKDLKREMLSVKEMVAMTSKETVEFKKSSLFGPLTYTYPAILTPHETIAVEIRINRTDNPVEARKLQALLDAREVTATGGLPQILMLFSSEKGELERKEAQIIEARASQSEKYDLAVVHDQYSKESRISKKSVVQVQVSENGGRKPDRDLDILKVIR